MSPSLSIFPHHQKHQSGSNIYTSLLGDLQNNERQPTKKSQKKVPSTTRKNNLRLAEKLRIFSNRDPSLSHSSLRPELCHFLFLAPHPCFRGRIRSVFFFSPPFFLFLFFFSLFIFIVHFLFHLLFFLSETPTRTKNIISHCNRSSLSCRRSFVLFLFLCIRKIMKKIIIFSARS